MQQDCRKVTGRSNITDRSPITNQPTLNHPITDHQSATQSPISLHPIAQSPITNQPPNHQSPISLHPITNHQSPIFSDCRSFVPIQSKLTDQSLFGNPVTHIIPPKLQVRFLWNNSLIYQIASYFYPNDAVQIKQVHGKAVRGRVADRHIFCKIRDDHMGSCTAEFSYFRRAHPPVPFHKDMASSSFLHTAGMAPRDTS